MFKYGSVCSGIEAASVAWKPLGWHPVFFSEIEPFCCRLLAERFPSVPNLGDLTQYKDWNHEPIDLLVGGTPCQSFSVAGRRSGLNDERGQLLLSYFGLAKKLRPQWLIWENVPGVLSSNDGFDFGAFIGALGQLGYGIAYRVLDAQYFGVPQRRRRVFVVGHLGDWRRAAEVLFERTSCASDVVEEIGPETGGSTNCYFWKEHQNGRLGTLKTVAGTLEANTGGRKEGILLIDQPALRHFTPREYERLQGFPDDWTLIIGAKDTERYQRLGNSMAVPVVRWIGKRISACLA